MVVMPKHNRDPISTVDMQALKTECVQDAAPVTTLAPFSKFQFWQETVQFAKLRVRHLLKPNTWAAGTFWTEDLEEVLKPVKQKIIEAVTNGVKPLKGCNSNFKNHTTRYA